MAKSQDERQFTQMAGEFGVVSELFRRHIQATITYGNSKRADVFVIASDGDRAAKIEVKSSVEKGWIVDDRALDAKNHVVWVFVYLPQPSEAFSPAQVAEVGKSASRYHVLTSAEVRDLYVPKKAGGGTPITFSVGDVEKHLNKWSKVPLALARR